MPNGVVFGKLTMGESSTLTQERYDEAIQKLRDNKMLLVNALRRVFFPGEPEKAEIIHEDNVDIITEQEYIENTIGDDDDTDDELERSKNEE